MVKVKITGGAPEVCSNISLTLLNFGIGHFTFYILHFTFDIQPMDQWTKEVADIVIEETLVTL